MDKEQMLSMDSYMLLSVINMKLRDDFMNFHELCLQYDIEDKIIINKLKNIGYIYNSQTNKFISM